MRIRENSNVSKLALDGNSVKISSPSTSSITHVLHSHPKTTDFGLTDNRCSKSN